MTQAEFYILMKHADVFELVYFSKEFTAQAAKLIENHPMMKTQDIKLGEGHDMAEIQKWLMPTQQKGFTNRENSSVV